MKSKNIREWVPTAFMLAMSDDLATEITFCPRQVLDDPAQKFISEICVYDPETGRPCHRVRGEPFNFDDYYRISSNDLRPHIKSDAEILFCEAFNVAVGTPPQNDNIALPSNIHYLSKNGTLQGEIASSYIYGMPRKAFKGAFYYDNFPAGNILPGTTLKIFLLNPYVRSSTFQIFARTRSGDKQIGEGTVSAKSVGQWVGDAALSESSADPFAVVVASELKLNLIYSIIDCESKVMYGLDHGHPFLLQLLAH